MTKVQAQDLLDSSSWNAFLKVTFKQSYGIRQQLLIAKDLTDRDRMYYAGQMMGVYQAIRAVYFQADVDVPPEVRDFFRGEKDL